MMNQHNEKIATTPKKDYVAPAIQELGSVNEVTRSVAKGFIPTDVDTGDLPTGS